ncbi:hypothetical protein CCACVL1_05992 [Corchorus capsularis]|uniref:Uncharacterized protein n=1 Tax=Corchorus capsularis TaxID=210143 RepID=A0A1R3JHW1_COCAP|nr:hypothetical protein CCACVL1_05992 [Corchorus capsularis]
MVIIIGKVGHLDNKEGIGSNETNPKRIGKVPENK